MKYLACVIKLPNGLTNEVILSYDEILEVPETVLESFLVSEKLADTDYKMVLLVTNKADEAAAKSEIDDFHGSGWDTGKKERSINYYF